MSKRGVLVLVCLLAASACCYAYDWSYYANYGRVSRLYFHSEGVCFTLTGGQTAMGIDLYYFVPMTHTNYKSLVALLLVADAAGEVIKVETQHALVDGKAVVVYIVKDRDE